MTESTGTAQKEQIQSQPAPVSSTNRAPQSDEAKCLKIFIGVCSVGIIGCFFLPWVQFLFGTPSGYELQQLPSDEVKLVWFIPVAALLALFAVASGKGMAAMAGIAGLAPFLTLIYYTLKYGADLYKDLKIGAHVTFLLAAILFVLAARMSRIKR